MNDTQNLKSLLVSTWVSFDQIYCLVFTFTDNELLTDKLPIILIIIEHNVKYNMSRCLNIKLSDIWFKLVVNWDYCLIANKGIAQISISLLVNVGPQAGYCFCFYDLDA